MIYQIYFDPESKKRIMKGAKGIFNGSLHPSFENSVIAREGLEIQDDSFGFLSHKFKLKHTHKRYNAEAMMEAAQKVDVLSFFKAFKSEDMVAYLSQNMNYDFKTLLNGLLAGTGYEVPDKTSFIVYQNAFIAKKEVYHDYIKSCLMPAFRNAWKWEDELWKSTNYKGNFEALGALNTRYQKRMSKYPIWPFAFELLFSIYLEHKDLKCEHY